MKVLKRTIVMLACGLGWISGCGDSGVGTGSAGASETDASTSVAASTTGPDTVTATTGPSTATATATAPDVVADITPTMPPPATVTAPPRARPTRAAPAARPGATSTSAAIATAPPASADSKDPLVRARARLDAGDTAGAIGLLERELLDTPGRPALYDLLGDARLRTGNRIAAIGAYRRYLALVGADDATERTARVRGKLTRLGGL